MGHTARLHPEELIYGLLETGTSALCYDGQPFFDTDHPSIDATGDDIVVSNDDAGGAEAGPAWYLFDTSRAIKPIIWQERETYDFKTVTRPDDARVFMTDEFLDGVRARAGAGVGLWQLTYASRAPLTLENDIAARTAMMVRRTRGRSGPHPGDQADPRVTPPELEDDALPIVNAELTETGGSTPARIGLTDDRSRR